MCTSLSHPQVREYVHAAQSTVQLSEAQTEQLRKDVESKKATVEQWCKTAYGEVRRAVQCCRALEVSCVSNDTIAVQAWVSTSWDHLQN